MKARLVVQDPALAGAIVSDAPTSLRLLKPDWREDVCGHSIEIGAVEHHLASAVIANRAELEAKLPLQPGVELHAVFAPGENGRGVMRHLVGPRTFEPVRST
jgi:hypothetical protein